MCASKACGAPPISQGGLCEEHTMGWLRSPEFKKYQGSLESCRLGIAAYTKRLNGEG